VQLDGRRADTRDASIWRSSASMNSDTSLPIFDRRSTAALIRASCPATSRPPSVVSS
jgi:hypothetical protein